MSDYSFQPGADNAAGTYVHDNLFGGDHHGVTKAVVIDTGVLPRGAVLGRITANGKWILSAAAATDGSEVPRAILAEATDASAGDKSTIAYLTGQFNVAALTFGAGHTAASTEDGLRDLGIFLKTNQPA